MVRQRDIEFSALVSQKIPLMKEAILNVGHRQTRTRGTYGGSLSHLDPSAELPTVSMAQDAIVSVRKKGGERDIAMADFPMGYMTPSFDLDEMVTDIRVPIWPEGHGYASSNLLAATVITITSSAVLLTWQTVERLRKPAYRLRCRAVATACYRGGGGACRGKRFGGSFHRDRRKMP